MYYNRHRDNIMVRCNFCDETELFSNRSHYQLFYGTIQDSKHEANGWIRTDYNATACPSCAKILKEGVEEVKFNLVATQGFSDKELVCEALEPLKGIGHRFVTDIHNHAITDVARVLGLPLSHNQVEADVADVVVIFRHVDELASDLLEKAKLKTKYVYTSTKKKDVSPMLEHLNTAIENMTKAEDFHTVNAEDTVHTDPITDSGKQEQEQTEDAPTGEAEKPTE